VSVAIPDRVDVVVVGSGIVGSAVAFNLAEAGAKVAVVERGEFCGEASGANVGLVTISTKAPGVLLDLARLSIGLYPTLSERLGRDIQYRRSGGIVVAMTPEALDARRRLTEVQQAEGLDVRHVTAEEALDLEPSLPETILGGSYSPLDGYVYPFAIVGAYIARAAELGARMVPKTEVTGFRIEGDRLTGVETSRGTIATEWAVNAAGAWAGAVSELAGLKTPVIPVRGQVLLTEPMPPFVRHVVLGVEPSLRQTFAGNGVIGSTTEYVGHVKLNTLVTMRHFARGIIGMYPHLGDTQIIRMWAGLRPGTPDEIPIVGASRRIKGFAVGGGTFRYGMVYGPAVGQVLAEEIMGKPLSVNVDAARPERFEERPAVTGSAG
jgi:sarcosine oxidase subunit beta